MPLRCHRVNSTIIADERSENVSKKWVLFLVLLNEPHVYDRFCVLVLTLIWFCFCLPFIGHSKCCWRRTRNCSPTTWCFRTREIDRYRSIRTRLTSARWKVIKYTIIYATIYRSFLFRHSASTTIRQKAIHRIKYKQIGFRVIHGTNCFVSLPTWYIFGNTSNRCNFHLKRMINRCVEWVKYRYIQL